MKGLANFLKQTLGDAPPATSPYPYVCAARASDGTVACTPSEPKTIAVFTAVQDAINRAAVKLGLATQPSVSTDGTLSAETADVAYKVLVKAPQTDRVKAYLADSRVTDRNYLQQWFASDPLYAIATFDEVSGYKRPGIQADPRGSPPAAAPAPAGPVTKTFWTKRNVAVVGIGVFVLGLTVFAVSRVRNAAISDYRY